MVTQYIHSSYYCISFHLFLFVCLFVFPLATSDLPWFKVFYRIMDKISDMQLAFQVIFSNVLFSNQGSKYHIVVY